MGTSEVYLFDKVRLFSSLCVGLAILASIIFSSWMGSDNLSWQVFIAILALAIGIPHGALDHLVTIPNSDFKYRAIFIFIYVLVAVLAVIVLLQWNVIGFIFVVAMSATHFGIGDAAFISELDRRSNYSNNVKFSKLAYGTAAGLIPVIIPLVNQKSTNALASVNPVLINWHQGYSNQISGLVYFITLCACAILLLNKGYRDLLDIALLAALVYFAPPLVAFAIYFGCWHAMRHTVRLTLSLPNCKLAFEEHRPIKAFFAAVKPGLPALVATFIVVGILAISNSGAVGDNFLWLTLVIVWALTVPHMIVTAKLDRIALKI